jgi:hypothetical protein
VMHDAIGEEMQRIADENGQGAALNDARNYWRRMKQTFGKPLAQNDVATKTLKGAASDVATAQERANQIRLLGSFDPNIPKMFSHVENVQQGVEAMPKPVSPRELTQGAKIPNIPPRKPVVPPVEPKPVPLPERVAPPDRPVPQVADIKKIGLKDIQQAKEDVLKNGKAGKVGSIAKGAGTWHVISSAMYGNPIGVATGSAVAASPGLFAKVLRNPTVVRILSQPTPADIAAIPPEVRGNLPAIVDAAQKQGIKVHPSILLMARPNATQQ